MTMNSMAAVRTAIVIALITSVPTDSSAQTLHGQVVDAVSGAGLAGVRVSLSSGGRQITEQLTDASGNFRLAIGSARNVIATISTVGYTTLTDTVVFDAADVRRVYRLNAQTVSVDALRVDAEAKRWMDVPQPVGPSYLVAGAELAKLELSNASLKTAVRALPGVRSRQAEYIDELRRLHIIECYEYSRRQASILLQRLCDNIFIVVDGSTIDDPVAVANFMRSEPISAFESIQLLTGTQAHQRFGMEAGSRGVLMFFSRGRGPYVSPAREPK